MKLNNIPSGFYIMIGLAIAGAMLPVAVRTFRAADRTVAVKGLCEREVPADKVIWPIQYKCVGNELDKIYTEIEAKNAQIIAFLNEGGIDGSAVGVSVPVVSDKFAQEYGSNDRTFRYVAKCNVTVCTDEVDKVIALMSRQKELVKFGIAQENDWDCKTVFSFEGLNEIKPEMIQEATRNAREAALKFAADSHSSIGKIKTAGQGTFSIEDRDSSTPQIKKVRVVTNVVYYLNK